VINLYLHLNNFFTKNILNLSVALKQLRPQIDLRDEINAMKKINNQFVITFYEGFKVELNYFIVMEYCQVIIC